MKSNYSFIRSASLALLTVAMAGNLHAAIKDGLAAHLTFDSDYKDDSGKGTHGTVVGAPKLDKGYIGGKAVFVSNAGDGSSSDYVTLTGNEVLFGENIDFTVAMWVQLNGFKGDPAFFGNKNWGSGGNLGYVIATGDDRHFQWNYKEDSCNRRDYDGPGGTLTSNVWHHIAVVFENRGKTNAQARSYLDGSLVDTRPLSTRAGADPCDPSTVDTDALGLAVNIGNDGTGVYTDGANAVSHGNTGIDDFGLWRRGLSGVEISRIVEFGKLGTNIVNVPETKGPSVDFANPLKNAKNVGPNVVLEVRLKDAGTKVVPGTVKLSFDGAVVSATATKQADVTTVSFDPPGLLAKSSTHTYKVQYSDDGTPALSYSEEFPFTVRDYVDLNLPTPLVRESFDGIAEGKLPAGWTVENVTDDGSPGEDLTTFKSDSFKDWVVVDRARSAEFTAGGDYGGLLNVAPDQYVSGQLVTNLLEKNFLFASSTDRPGKQVQYATTADYDISGKSNLYLYFHSAYTQNQDSSFSVEYSVDGGITWLPALYCLDAPDILRDAKGSIDVTATFNTGYTDVAKTKTDPATGDPVNGTYGDFIKAKLTPDLAPFISSRVNDDQVESKRVEFIRLAGADGKAKVRIRFANSGTDSWYAAIDEFRLYSIVTAEAPKIAAQPQNATVTAGSAATFSVSATGTGVSYQWKLNGGDIGGATSSSLTLNNVTTANAGSYTVVVSNSAGSVTTQAATLTVNAPVVAAQITDGLLAYLKFDGDLKDASGNGNNGTAVGTPTIGPGKIGSGALVVNSKKDGTSFNYVTLGTPNSLKLGTNMDFTVSFWANYAKWEGDPAFVSNKDWNSGGNIGFAVATDGDGRLQWNYRVTGGAARKDYDGPGGSFTGGGWHHVVVSFAANGDAKSYLDGKLVNTTAIGPSTGTVDSGLPINIGQDGTGKYTDGNKVSAENGLIDEVAIWRRVLDVSEVQKIFVRGSAGVSLDAPAITEDLAVHLTFDADFKDASGNGNNGTAVGTPTIGPGKIGSGALVVNSKKDGTSFNYVTLGTPDSLKLGTNTDFTVSFWANYAKWEGDPAFVSNKDWNSGGNIGFVVATDSDGRLQWNYRVTGGAARKDYDGPGGTFTGGGWHHVVVSFARNGDSKSYVDGKLVNTTAIGPTTGTIDSGLPINIGQDGAGKYTDGNKVGSENALIDDVAIWRRLLSEAEVQKIFTAGAAGQSFEGSGGGPRLAAGRTSTGLTISWSGAGTLESADSVAGPWSTVSNAASPFNVQITGAQKYYRLKQ